jgi:hypothetical protein
MFTLSSRDVSGRGDEGAKSGISKRVTVKVYLTYDVIRFISYCNDCFIGLS